MKKLLSILLALTMLVGMTAVAAADGNPGAARQECVLHISVHA